MIWLYTFKGGIKTIIWTDALQTIFMLVAVVVSIVLISKQLNLDFKGMINTITESSHSKIFYFDDFKNDNPLIHPLEREEIFKQDYVLILRSPHEDEFTLLGKNSCLISMLHYQTHPSRLKIMKDNNIQAISLDSIMDFQQLLCGFTAPMGTGFQWKELSGYLP